MSAELTAAEPTADWDVRRFSWDQYNGNVGDKYGAGLNRAWLRVRDIDVGSPHIARLLKYGVTWTEVDWISYVATFAPASIVEAPAQDKMDLSLLAPAMYNGGTDLLFEFQGADLADLATFEVTFMNGYALQGPIGAGEPDTLTFSLIVEELDASGSVYDYTDLAYDDGSWKVHVNATTASPAVTVVAGSIGEGAMLALADVVSDVTVPAGFLRQRPQSVRIATVAANMDGPQAVRGYAAPGQGVQ